MTFVSTTSIGSAPTVRLGETQSCIGEGGHVELGAERIRPRQQGLRVGRGGRDDLLECDEDLAIQTAAMLGGALPDISRGN